MLRTNATSLDVLALGKSGSGKSDLINAIKAWKPPGALSSEAQAWIAKKALH